MNPEEMNSRDDAAVTPSEDERHEPEPETIEHQIGVLRDEIGGLMQELDRRRHEALDWRLQLQRHGATIALAVTAMVLLAAGWSAFAARRRAIDETAVARVRNLLRALDGLSRHPDAVRT
jgi:hypothetical protein